ncbi:cytochrome P450 [Streptomyces tateyamensis]|uniref:Cytochrome P450 n=1 Tax=Streptomyces tateyamensis TaxID=565073 RepID=A0A2V4N1M2_9ACTN|nr:cytochrome P450 [Streptomyces tateyamensis]PYC77809.1 cytochrome P450 [Streptomyces tateyamensis]
MDEGTEIINALMSPEAAADPYPLYRRARELGPAVPVWDDMLLATDYATVHQLLRDPKFGVPAREHHEAFEPTFAEHSSLVTISNSILWTNAPHHARVRSLIASVFTARRIALLAPAVEAAVARMLDELAELGAGGTPVDFMDTFAFRLPVGVICELLGVPEQDRYRFRALATDLTVALEVLAGSEELAAADEATEELRGYFAELAAQRRAHPREDLVSALVQVVDGAEQRLSDEELLANLVLLLVAGFETTTNLLGNGLDLVFRHPWTLDGLRTGRIAPASFTEEVLRYESPVQLTTRVPLAAGLSVAGVPVPEKGGLFLLLGGANRDGARYVDPDVFDPLRTDSQPLSFGGGVHYCLGAQLAKLEATTALPALLNRFPTLARAGEPVRRARLVLRGFESFPLLLAG